MRVAWATDIHLDAAMQAGTARFIDQVRSLDVEALLLTGDISSARRLVDDLRDLRERLAMPVHYVLGNHDFYGGSIKGVRESVAAIGDDDLRYLSTAGVVPLTDSVSLVGHDGWADARIGSFMTSQVILNDDVTIRELMRAGAPEDASEELDRLWGWEHKDELARVLGELGDEAAATLRPQLEAALSRTRQVVVLTHVPPFKGACWHRGVISGDDWLPRFTCQAVGDVLLEAAREHAEAQITVLCGHTHGEGEYRPVDNLLVRTGGAEYTRPVARVIVLDD